MLKRLFNYFLQGLLFTIPLAILFSVVFGLLRSIDAFVPQFIPSKFWFPGMGLLILLCIITLIGFLGNTVIAGPINFWFNKVLDRIPLIKTAYTALTDFTQAIIGGKERKFTQPVLVQLSDVVEKPGFVTQNDLSGLGISEDKVMVYLPHSYGFTGNIFIVPKKNVTALNVKASDMMKTILSGGVSGSGDNGDAK